MAVVAMTVAFIATVQAQAPSREALVGTLAVLANYKLECGDLAPNLDALMRMLSANYGNDSNLVHAAAVLVKAEEISVGRNAWCAATTSMLQKYAGAAQ